MSSTFSPSLRIELIGAGEQAGTWNTTTNTNLGTLLETAIAGNVTVSITSASQALIAINGVTDQARQAILTLTTTTSAPFSVYAPPQPKVYVIYNTTAYDATIYNSTALGNTTAAGTGVVVLAGKKLVIFSDAANFYTIDAASLTSILAVANGGTGVTTSTGTGSTVLSTSPTLVTPALGTPTTLVGTNITGTAAGLSIGGNATTATTAINATTAVAATTLVTTGFSVVESGGKLYFKYGTTNIASMDSSGNFTTLANITAYTTP